MTRAVLRSKGQVTLPREVREALHIDEGDDVAFVVTEEGVLMRGLRSVPADQAWFWDEDWQAGERQASADISAGRVHSYTSPEEFLRSLG